MKSVILTTLGVVLALPAAAQVHVQGHIRRDGTYVAPHIRSAPDSNRFNNYSTQGNTKPYTGRSGSVNPYSPPSFGSQHNGNFGNGFGERQRRNPWGN